MSSAPESSPRRGLGRGLEVLIGGHPVPSELLEIPVDAIHPNPRQPRRRFEPEAASGLAESVRRAVRATINEQWGKKPLCYVHVMMV